MLIWFDNEKSNQLNEVGGKAYNLSKMIRSGIDIPNGFTISSQDYENYIESNNLKSKIDLILSKEMPFSESAKEIQNLFHKDLISEELLAELGNAFSKLGAKQVAVRSSSTAEDLPGFSFAGQYSSFLNVTKDRLVESVINCWKSLWNERAIAYRKEHFKDNEFSHAVVVQEMVDAEISGVVFSSNPMNNDRNAYVINVSYGLGEAIVSGSIMPDQIICSVDELGTMKTEMESRIGTKIETKIGTKKSKYVYSEKGIVEVAVAEELRTQLSMNLKQVSQLVNKAFEITSLYGQPQDIEFAFNKEGKLYILQSRNITSLYPVDHLKQDGKLRAYMAASTVLLGMKEPFTPLGADIYGGMFPTVLEVMTARKKKLPRDFVSYNSARIFVDISYMLSSKFVAKNFANAFSGSDLPLKLTMDQLLSEHGTRFRNQGIKFKFSPSLIIGLMKYSFSMVRKMKGISKRTPEEKYAAIIGLGNEFVDEIEKKSVELETAKDILSYCDEIMLKAFKLTQRQALYCIEVGNYAKLEKKIKSIHGSKYNLDRLTYALPNCITVEMGLELNRLAQYFDEENVSVDAKHEKFRKFLSQFGHRGTIELDLGTKRWREDPTYLVNQVNKYITDKNYLKNLEDVKFKALGAQAFIEEVHKETSKVKSVKVANKLRNMMLSYRSAAGMREYPKYNIVQGLNTAKVMLLKLGDQMKEKGYIEDKEDIFYLHKNQILDVFDGKIVDAKALIRGAKQNYFRELKRNSVPRFVLNTGKTYYSHLSEPTEGRENILQGISLSSGIYEGNIRIVTDPLESDLKLGEVLVAESTNPAWTPLFMTAGALIMEYGGPLSHGGIVAREYGLPAVVGISTMSGNLKNGQKVRVDGNTGIVEILDTDN